MKLFSALEQAAVGLGFDQDDINELRLLAAPKVSQQATYPLQSHGNNQTLKSGDSAPKNHGARQRNQSRFPRS
jgi:hypothetical protein